MANAECGIGGNEYPPLCFYSAFRRSRRVRSAHHIAGAKKRCASAPYKLLLFRIPHSAFRIRDRSKSCSTGPNLSQVTFIIVMGPLSRYSSPARSEEHTSELQ